uniref:Uncharacterized protein n=1 Tax=Desulfobacca acetoxidans TaxID=60893 RepID=A0A7V4G767_9BACT
MRPVAYFIAGVLILLLFNMELGRRVFAPTERQLLSAATQSQADSDDQQLAVYKKVRLAFSSFDLFNGLTRQEIEDLPSQRALTFHGLVAVLMAVAFLRHGKPKKP